MSTQWKKRNASQATPKVVVLGGINRDYVILGQRLPRAGETVLGQELLVGPGGKGANQAVGAHRLGAEVSLIGAVGSDATGEGLLQGLTEEGVDVSHVSITSKSVSGTALILVDSTGEKMIGTVVGANRHVTVAQVRKARRVIEAADVLLLQFEIPMPALREAARLAYRAGVTVILDAGPPIKSPEILWQHIHILRANATEAQALTGLRIRDERTSRRAGATLLKRGLQAVILPTEQESDLMLWNGSEAILPWFQVKTVDATGAGDAFAAGLAVGLGEGLSLIEAGRLGSAAAALKTTRKGAQARMPTRQQTHHLLLTLPQGGS